MSLCIYCSAIFPRAHQMHSNACRNLLNLTKYELDGFAFCLRIRMHCFSEGLILHVRQHGIVWKYIKWTYSGTEEAYLCSQGRAEVCSHLWEWRQMWNVKLQIFCSQGRGEVRKRHFPYLAMKTIFIRTSDLWQSRLKESAEAKLQIFASPDRDEMRKRNVTSLEVLTEQVRKAELQIFASQGRAEVQKQNFTYLPAKAERKCGSGT